MTTSMGREITAAAESYLTACGMLVDGSRMRLRALLARVVHGPEVMQVHGPRKLNAVSGKLVA